MIKLSNLLLLILAVLLISGCGSKQEGSEGQSANISESILGTWQAKWNKTQDEKGFSKDQLKMNGKMEFDEDHVHITVYGFDGCIFFSDTVTSKLKWKIEDSVIRFIDLSDDQGLPYNIEQFSDDKMKLSLMEDIEITLAKQN